MCLHHQYLVLNQKCKIWATMISQFEAVTHQVVWKWWWCQILWVCEPELLTYWCLVVVADWYAMAECNYAEKSSNAILEPLVCSISFLLWKLPLCLCTGCPPVHIHFNNFAPLQKGNTTTTLLAKIFWWAKQIKSLVWRNKIAQKLPDHHIVDRTRRWLPWMPWRKALATTSIRKRHKMT